MSNGSDAAGLVLLTGATGYVGGRLLGRIERPGRRLRCLVRRPGDLEGRVGPGTEVVEGDLLRPDTLDLSGVDVAVYLVHSMGSDDDFEVRDRAAAEHFARAAARAGVRRIVYLGGLGCEHEDLSPHLRSRHEVGRILRTSGAQVIELRASIVLGAGSLSFELVRALVERLPVMITPRWVDVPAQPIAIEDLLDYLMAAIDLELDDTDNRVFEIGGSERVSYGDLMREYAHLRGLRRRMFRVPVLTPRLSGLWLGLVTPLYARVGQKLVESIRHPTVVEDDSALDTFPIRPMSCREAIAAALRDEDREIAKTRWCDALSAAGEPRTFTDQSLGGRRIDARRAVVEASPAAAFAPIRQIGGETGWYAFDGLWRLRGWADLLLGGVGLRRGRRSREDVRVGDTLDCWRVEAYEPDRLLRLSAEMKLPGRAWLQFEVHPHFRGAEVLQTAIFDPLGLAGLLYWYGIYPLHLLVFRGMIRGLARAGVAGLGAKDVVKVEELA